MAYELRSVDAHLAQVLDEVLPLPPIDVGLVDARGCILAEDVIAPWPLPAFDNAAVDGYAVQWGAVAGASLASPVRLQVVDDIPAGKRPRASVGIDTAARIMTGAPVPYGADAVVPVEDTDGGMPHVTVNDSVAGGANIRRAGDDVPSGSVVLAGGTVLGARQAALAAAVGRGRVRVHPRPRVVVLTTGSELVQPGEPLGPGLINDVNGVSLAIAASDIGADVYRVGTIRDDAVLLTSTLEDQLVRADVIITTGGASVGAYDTVKQVLSQLGTVEFVRLAMQPGMPQGYGQVDSVPIFTLPGNPVSAFVSFEVFVRPVLRRMLGYAHLYRPTVQAVVTNGFESPAGKRQFVRGQLRETSEGFDFVPSPGQASHQVGALSQATGLAVIGESTTEVSPGSVVSVMRLDGDHDG